MNKLRVGIVGLGGIAKDAHIPALKSNSKVEIVAVCDINKEKFALADKEMPKAKKYIDYKEMIDSEELDLVHICTPNYLHSKIAVYALNRKINVFCEKPDAISVAEAEVMKKAEQESGCRLMVMRNNRYYTPSVEIKKLIDNGEMGELYAGRCGWIRRRGIPGKGGWFTTKEQSGGGPLIDLGVHMIDLAVYLMGNPKAVSVSGSTFRKFAETDDKSDSVHSAYGESVENGVFDVEDLAMGFIKFDNGACLQIEFSWASNIKKEEKFVELRGTKGGFTIKDGFYDIYTPHIKQRSFFEKLKKVSIVNGHRANINHFIEVLTNGDKPDFTIDQGINMIKILQAIYKSAETGKEIIL